MCDNMILVTGATGFLGKRVCNLLDLKKIEYYPTSYSLGTDLRDENQTNQLFNNVRPDYVLNCASYVGGIQFGIKHEGELFRNNSLMITNLFEACRKYNVKRLINPISNCVYPSKAMLFREDEIWDGALHNSVFVYGMMRKMSYVASYAYKNQYNLDTINLILSNMYGPEDHFEEERSHALGALVMKFVNARDNNLDSVEVWGTGDPVREWLFVDDGAEAMIRAINIDSHQEPINIGLGRGISIKDLALMIKKIVQYNGEIVFNTSKIDGAPYKTVDGSLGYKLLNWKPNKNFEEGVKETVEWYEKNVSK